MALIRNDVRRMMYALGFLHAPDWNDDKLREMTMAAGSNIDRSFVPEKYHELFESIKQYAKSGEFIVWAKPKIKRK